MNVEFVPCVGQQFADAAVRMRRKRARQIAQIREGVQPGALGVGGTVGGAVRKMPNSRFDSAT
ncbi:hypothetical protein HY256_12930 [Candidatus Sumerlaeota bacterium]|nr:hypothetical protein [Candidatus Sumerlaeota bacterium]